MLQGRYATNEANYEAVHRRTNTETRNSNLRKIKTINDVYDVYTDILEEKEK